MKPPVGVQGLLGGPWILPVFLHQMLASDQHLTNSLIVGGVDTELNMRQWSPNRTQTSSARKGRGGHGRGFCHAVGLNQSESKVAKRLSHFGIEASAADTEEPKRITKGPMDLREKLSSHPEAKANSQES